MESKLMAVAVTLALALVGVEGAGECPKNPTQKMQECAEKININLNIAEGHKFITDPKYTQMMCKQKIVQEAINCMDKIFNACKDAGTDEQDLMVKPLAWKAAIKELCDNSKFLDDNQACVQKSGRDMAKCVEDYSKQAEAEINLKTIDRATKGKGKERKVFKIVCSLAKNLNQCFDNTLHKQCPKKMEQLMNDMFYMFLPPVCHPADAKYTFVSDDESSKDDNKGGGAATISLTSFLLIMPCILRLL